jgi:hypothetical protein
MRFERRWRLVLLLLTAAGLAAGLIVPAAAQQSAAPSTAPATAPPKPKPAPKPAAPKPAAAPAAAPAAKPASPAAAVAGGAQPKLLGQYGEWGAYSASPSGKKVCFVLAKPTSSTTVPPNRPRNPIYMFISTRPADKVANEISIIIGYPFKPGSDATVQIGSTTFALYTQQDGAWIKNAADEANMITAMRSGESAVIKGASAKGTQSSDTYTLRGISQALDRVAQDCK